MKPEQPPSHLSAAMKSWWLEVHRTYQLEAHHRHLLQLACEAFDECQRARAVLAEAGTTVPTKNGVKAHPDVARERDARLAFARLVRELDLDTEPPVPARSAPPALHSNRRPRRGAIVQFVPRPEDGAG